jgi:hypothetical protein
MPRDDVAQESHHNLETSERLHTHATAQSEDGRNSSERRGEEKKKPDFYFQSEEKINVKKT